MCHFFASVVIFHENSLLGCPPVLHHAPVTTFFSSFLVIYLHFLRKLAPWMSTSVDARGRRTVRTPLCTPLILTNLFVQPKNKSILFVSVAIYSKYLACLPVSVGLRPAQLA